MKQITCNIKSSIREQYAVVIDVRGYIDYESMLKNSPKMELATWPDDIRFEDDELEPKRI
jgi:hypothetical protein